MSDLEIHVENHPAGTVVRLIGQGTVNTAQRLNQALEQLAQAGPAQVVADLSGLTFACSMVMGALVQFRARLRANDGVLKMAGLSPDVAIAFQCARLDWVIPTFPTVEQALASTDPPPASPRP